MKEKSKEWCMLGRRTFILKVDGSIAIIFTMSYVTV